jgi:hypothetical protein
MTPEQRRIFYMEMSRAQARRDFWVILTFLIIFLSFFATTFWLTAELGS